MWVWDQSAGTLMNRRGELVGRGYAGHEWGRNNPEAQAAVGLGPVPRGRWKIGPPRLSETTGPYTLDLWPEPGTDTCGRTAFRIHGDSLTHPGQASHGCIILPPSVREAIWTSGDHDLEVVA
jgi:hypothetical protein